jgi:hypothetical protein
MKRRGVASPDIADALACTFACEYATLPVSDWAEGAGDHLVVHEYDSIDPRGVEQATAGAGATTPSAGCGCAMMKKGHARFKSAALNCITRGSTRD